MIRFIVVLSSLLIAPQALAVSGSLKSSTDFYQQKLGKPTDDLVPFGQLELNDKHKFTKRFRFQWKLVALGNFEAEKPGANEERLAHEQSFVDLPEAFFEYRDGASKFRVGMNTVNWGVVDVSSPSNVVNTSAFLHPLRLPKRGSPMVEWQWDRESFGISALYIPRQPRSVLPARDSRWLPRDVLTNMPVSITTDELGTVELPDELRYSYISDRELDHARDHNYGVRLKSNLGSFDLQLTYFEGMSPFPKIRVQTVLNPSGSGFVADPEIGLGQTQYKVRNSGFGMSYAAEKVILRLESVYQHTVSDVTNQGIHPWVWSSVAGAETNFDVGTSSVTILAQYYHTEIPTKADNLISSSYRLFDRTGVLGVRWPASDAWLFSASALFETQSQGLFWSAGAENKISDALRMGVSWRDFSAQKDGLIKTFDKNDHANLDLTYFF